MKNISSLANEFYNLVKVAAGRQNRKQLEKDLSFAKDSYTKRRLALDSHKKSHKELEDSIAKLEKEVSGHKSNILKMYDVLKNMDLFDISEVRFINDDVGYVRGNRLYRIEDGDLVPFRSKKKGEEAEVDADISDEDLSADELLAKLVEE